MNWINNLFYMGLFTALTGSIAFAVYAVVAGVLDGLKKYRYIYGLLLVVLPFWLFPGLFLLLYVTHYRKMGEALFIKGHLFELTPVIAHIECVAAVVWLRRSNGSCASISQAIPQALSHPFGFLSPAVPAPALFHIPQGYCCKLTKFCCDWVAYILVVCACKEEAKRLGL